MERPFLSDGVGLTTSVGTYGMLLTGVGADSAKFAEYRNFNRHGSKSFNAVFLDGSLKTLAWDNGNSSSSLGMRVGATYNYTKWTSLDQ